MRMLKRYPLVQAGNTKPAMTTFSDAIVLRDGDATRKEAIGRLAGDINGYAHASILYHLNCCQDSYWPGHLFDISIISPLITISSVITYTL